MRITTAQVIQRIETASGRFEFDLAVDAGESEIVVRGIPDTGFAYAGGLIVGVLLGGSSAPIFQPISGLGASEKIRGLIDSSEPASEPGRFKYTVAPAEGLASPGQWVRTPNAETITAYQPTEGFNGAGKLCSGIETANLNGYEPVPLAVDCPVIVEKVDGGFYITSAQAVDGACP